MKANETPFELHLAAALELHAHIVKLEVIMEDRWLSVDEIGAYLGIKRDTVYRWIDLKGMPAHRVGRLWKFKRDEVDEWVRSGGADASTDDLLERKSKNA